MFTHQPIQARPFLSCLLFRRLLSSKHLLTVSPQNAEEAHSELVRQFDGALSAAARTLNVDLATNPNSLTRLSMLTANVEASLDQMRKDLSLQFDLALLQASGLVDGLSERITIPPRTPGLLVPAVDNDVAYIRQWFNAESKRMAQTLESHATAVATAKKDTLRILESLISFMYKDMSPYAAVIPPLNPDSIPNEVHQWAEHIKASFTRNTMEVTESSLETSQAREEAMTKIIRGIDNFAHGVFDAAKVSKENWPPYSEFDPIIASSAKEFMDDRLRVLQEGLGQQRSDTEDTITEFITTGCETLNDLVALAEGPKQSGCLLSTSMVLGWWHRRSRSATSSARTGTRLVNQQMRSSM
jgi:hypothetical protein